MFKMKKILLTKQGFLKLKEEVDVLERIKLKKIRNDFQHISRDNELDSEYNAIVDDLLLIEKKLENTKTILRQSKVVDYFFNKLDKGIVNLGAKVKVIMGGVQTKFEIVDIMNTDPKSGKISTESPVGKALLGKREGESLFIPHPIGKVVEIKKVIYG